ncbi:MAG TPA: ATP-binding cassette domain-containing protein, partial [Myxococcota bacterium]|nr:ATP-binding cassette domain-containing protein [Myxococcota bacterium]
MTEATAPALEIDGVSHSYGTRRALSDVSFTVERGRFAALLGVNGAGKTTLFNLVTRLFDMRAGRIRVCGHSVRDAPTDALARLGVVFQSRAL